MKMKFSNATLDILKNYADINPGIQLKPGSKLATISPSKNILSMVTVEEEFMKPAAFYDLRAFLSLYTAHKETPTLEFGVRELQLVGRDGRSRTRYAYTDPSMITVPPDKEISIPSPDVSFTLTSDDLQWILKMNSVLGSPHVAIISNGKDLSIKSFDLDNSAENTNSLVIGEHDREFTAIFKTENLKLLPGSYTVDVSFAGVSRFTYVGDTYRDLVYFIAVEKDSKF
jgi:hypothetical protein